MIKALGLKGQALFVALLGEVYYNQAKIIQG